MSETDSTNSASEDNQGGSGESTTGQSNDGAGSGAFSSDEFEKKLEEQRRASQSRIDKMQKELDDLKAAQATPPAPEKDDSSTPPPGLTVEGLRAELRRQREVDGAVEDLRKAFPYADASVFSNLESYESAEALRAEAEASHKRTEALIQPALAAKEEEVKNRFVEAGYPDLGPADTGGDGEGSNGGDPTYEQILRMSLDEQDELGDEVIERAARAAGVTA